MRKLAYIFCIAINLLLIAGCATEHILPYNQGTNLINEKKYKSAIPYLKQAIQIKPDDVDSHVNLGVAYLNMGQTEVAINFFKNALRISPGYRLALGNLVLSYASLDPPSQEVVPILKEMIQLYPYLAEAYLSLGVVFINLDQPQSAIDPLNKAVNFGVMSYLTSNGAALAHASLGEAYENLGRNKEAIKEYKEALRIMPDLWQTIIVESEEMIKYKPDNATLHAALGFAYEKIGRHDDAISEYKEALRINPNLAIVRNDLNELEKKIAQGKSPSQEEQTPRSGSGTGFLFSSRDYIITNYHVVKGAGSIEVKFPDGKVIKAKVLAKDTQNDIAVLKLSQSTSTQIPDLNFGDSSKVRPGDRVFTIGYPASSILGKNQKITDGIVSSITGIEDDPTMFQITVPIQPGNSGGPLFNEKGEVIGITTASLSLNAIRSLGAVPQNVNYAIKSSFVKNLLATIPKTLLSNRGIVVVPNKPGNSLADFFERVSNNIVLIEAKE